jgi:hypothetical protein
MKARGRFKMDRNGQWPWNWGEEAEWKADLEERDYELLDYLIESAVEESSTRPSYSVGPPPEEKSTEDSTPEKYLVTA